MDECHRVLCLWRCASVGERLFFSRGDMGVWRVFGAYAVRAAMLATAWFLACHGYAFRQPSVSLDL